MVNGEEVATGRSVQVAFDYRTQQSVRVPEEWREKVRLLEKNPSL
jgi:acyl-CoA thioesterase FadM